jgi:ribosomal protein L37AE/L43A
MLCPLCGKELKKDRKKAEGVWDCTNCKGVFFILVIRGEK